METEYEYIHHQIELNGFKMCEAKRKAFLEENGIPVTDLFIFAQAY